jgi:hypothetical protein
VRPTIWKGNPQLNHNKHQNRPKKAETPPHRDSPVSLQNANTAGHFPAIQARQVSTERQDRQAQMTVPAKPRRERMSKVSASRQAIWPEGDP